MTDNVFLGSMTHNFQLDFRMAQMFYGFACKNRAIQQNVKQASLLAAACNDLWCTALNHRVANNLKWFGILHADIVPEQWWIDKMIEIANYHDADLLSAIVPIKEQSGVTSTAISGPDSFRRLTRLTQKQVNHPAWPETFDIDKVKETLFGKDLPEEYKIPYFSAEDRLLVNTGCMLARLDRPWCNDAYFTINDRVERTLSGQYYSEVEPEDWFFSRKVAELGGKVMATRAIKVEHIGSIPFRSDKAWGENVDPSTLTR